MAKAEVRPTTLSASMGNAVFVVPFSFGYFPDSHRGWASKRKVTFTLQGRVGPVIATSPEGHRDRSSRPAAARRFAGGIDFLNRT
ncbi:MAG: hypothetical protein U0289_04550 [Cyclobacteriaceae bacterium]